MSYNIYLWDPPSNHCTTRVIIPLFLLLGTLQFIHQRHVPSIASINLHLLLILLLLLLFMDDRPYIFALYKTLFNDHQHLLRFCIFHSVHSFQSLPQLKFISGAYIFNPLLFRAINGTSDNVGPCPWTPRHSNINSLLLSFSVVLFYLY